MAVLFGLVALVLLAGCKTRAMVLVTVKPDGSGTVAVEVLLDADAAKQVGDLSKLLAVGDLKRAGWTVTGPGWPPDVDAKLGRPVHKQGVQRGAVELHLERPFGDVDEANAILASLSGPVGPFQNVRISRSSSLSKTTLRVTGNVNLSKGLDTFGDAGLTRALGAPLSEVVARSGGSVPKRDDLVVTLDVQSDPERPWTGAAADRGVDPKFIQTSASLGERGEPIDVTTSWSHRGRVVLIAFGVLVVIAAIGVVVLRRRRGPRHRGPARRPARVASPVIDVPDPFATSTPPGDRPPDDRQPGGSRTDDDPPGGVTDST